MFFDELARGLSIGSRLWNAIKYGFARLLTTVGHILPGVSTLAACPALATSVASKELVRYGDQLARQQSLGERKTKLRRQLLRLSRPIVVFVDDIDRLEADVTKSLFRMIRVNANFPNIVYVLAFDRQHVERCLESDPGTSARGYLEKIIQVTLDIPTAEPTQLYQIFDSAFNDFLDSIETRPLDPERYRTVIDASFAVHFRTIRTVKRYLNCLRLTLPPIALEVDLVDFMGIELIRMFHPEIYSKVADARELLAVDALVPELLLEDDRDEARAELQREWFDVLATTLDTEHRNTLKKLLQILFPGFAGGIVRGEGEGNLESHWRKHGRVCSVDVFDKFFRLAVPSGRVSQTELDAFIAALRNYDTAVRSLKVAEQAGKIRDLLRRIGDVLVDIPEAKAATLAMAVLADTEWDRVDFGLTANWMIMACLGRQEGVRSRRNLMRKIAAEGETLLTVVEVVDRDQGGDEATGRVDDEMVKRVTIRRLKAAADDGSLWADARWYYMLSTWDKWGEPGEVRKAVVNWATTDEGLIQILEGERSTQASGVIGSRIQRLDTARLERWIDVEWAKQQLEGIVIKDGPNAGKARELIALFRDSIG